MLIKGLLPPNYADQLEQVLLGGSFPWMWNEVSATSTSFSIRDFQMVHYFIANNGQSISNFWELVRPVIHFVEKETGVSTKRVYRAKANLVPYLEYSPAELEASFHTDIALDNFMTMNYYVNTSDGNTVIKDKDGKEAESYPPIKNDCAWFKSNLLHRPTPPVRNKRRVVLNFVLEI